MVSLGQTLAELSMAKKQLKGRRKHIPLRRCVACGESMSKRSLVRIVRTADRGLVVDPTGKLAGRGAYLCRQETCWQKVAASKGILSRALRVNLSNDELDGLTTSWQALNKGFEPVAAQ